MLLEIKGLSSSYGRIQALRDISIGVAQGEIAALVGANGAGKSTLLKIISGVQPLTKGSIHFDGVDITQAGSHQRVRMGIAQVPEGRQVFSPMSVEDNLLLGAYTRKRQHRRPDLERYYAMFPQLKERRRQPAGTLSGGEQQMLAIARALMAAPRLLLLDEPSMGLAPLIVEQIFETTCSLKDINVTIFLVEQNAHAALSVSDRGYVMESGEIVMSDTGENLLSNARIKSAYLGS
ncbi:MAG: ABC transporter ATP-binding protein [Gammaproteobacteria bacterium]|nr:ABC transporter ATP-binding protein [Gammaproteobacteria bacterium]MDH3464724.1 ABC transporter ATP-binding protein [Gammaproteobacteria bacterium]